MNIINLRFVWRTRTVRIWKSARFIKSYRMTILKKRDI